MNKKYIRMFLSWLLGISMPNSSFAFQSPSQGVHPAMLVQQKHVPGASWQTTQPVDTISSVQTRSVPVPSMKKVPEDLRYVAEEIKMQRAWLYSAIVPGWGQICNAHYWKVPVIYIGFAGLIGGAVYYHKAYIEGKEEFMKRSKADLLKSYVDDCRMGRDLCVAFVVIWHIINMFDAHVGASLKTFTLSDDVSIQVQPNIEPTSQGNPTASLHLTLYF